MLIASALMMLPRLVINVWYLNAQLDVYKTLKTDKLSYETFQYSKSLGTMQFYIIFQIHGEIMSLDW